MHDSNSSSILVVQSRWTSKAVICNALTQNGYTCQSETSAQKAREFLESNHPHAVIIDTILPDISGFELCRWIRSQRGMHAIPIIMISGRSDLSTRLKGFMAGAQRFLCEPFSTEDLLAQVEFLIAREHTETAHGIGKQIDRELKTSLCI
jgi:DNA-binding response OmpR family regulator